MAKLDSLKISLQLEIKNQEKLKELQKAFKDLEKSGGTAGFDKLKQSLKDVINLQPKTIKGLQDQARALTKISKTLDVASQDYREVADAIKRAKAEMKALQNQAGAKPPVPAAGGMFGGFFGGKGLGFRGGLMAGAKQALPIAGTTALATALPGQAGFAALSGGAAGGLGGALAGAGIGLSVVASIELVKAGAAAAKYSSEIKRLEIALKGVTKTDKEFAKAQKIVASVSNELNVPIGDATKQFTTLSASVIGAGGNVDQAEEVFRGVSEAIKATGGDAEDVQSAMRAMSQIFGKGKVSAEELQGQLGERLPGAVTKFAEATGRTLPQLQKDLRDGTVGLNDVMKFVAKLSDDHRDAALKMAGSSAEAGARLTVAMQKLQKNIGDILQPIGAFFQDVFTDIVNIINKATEALMKFFGIGTANAIAKLKKQIEQREEQLAKGQGRGSVSLQLRKLKERLARLEGESVGDGDGTTTGGTFQDPAEDQDKFSVKADKEKAEQLMDEYVAGLGNVQTQIANTFISSFKKMEDALVNFVMTGKLNFRELARSIMADITRIFIRSMILRPIMSMFGGGNAATSLITNPFGTDSKYGGVTTEWNTDMVNAKGNVYGKNGIVPFAKGGIVDRPTIFPFANGVGLMSEAGPEAIMPLKRGKGGRLGVEVAGGGGSTVVNVSVDAKGTKVEGDEQQSAALGRMLATAVKSEISKQQRPGGLLYM